MATWNPGSGATVGDDTFIGDAGNDSADGGAGSDVLYGREGNDRLESGTNGYGDDRMYGGADNDTLIMRRYSSSTDLVKAYGQDGDDNFTIQMYGGTGRAYGGDGADTFNIISGGILAGGADSDTFTLNELFDFGGSHKPVVITDFETGAGGDVLNLSGLFDDLTNVTGNPFGTGHFRLLQSGAHTLVQADSDGGGNSWQTVVTLRNTVAADVLDENLVVPFASSRLDGRTFQDPQMFDPLESEGWADPYVARGLSYSWMEDIQLLV